MTFIFDIKFLSAIFPHILYYFSDILYKPNQFKPFIRRFILM